MPSPREQPTPTRPRRRQDTMPGGWLWVIVLLLLAGVLYFTVGSPGYQTIDYSLFVGLVKKGFVTKVTFKQGTDSLLAELDKEKVDALAKDGKDKEEQVLYRLLRNCRVETQYWVGDMQSGELSRLLVNVPHKTEPSMSAWIGPAFMFLMTLMVLASWFFLFFFARMRDPMGGNFLKK